ncbi:peptidase E [Salmonella enterica subsp. enterica]|uniref:Peptidase E n=1 Tax=Salmonella enterica I TaxID=59201 RepID=A0A447TQ58_SALET|nr:peptidase E [Salmonella enterica subsp. enterica]
MSNGQAVLGGPNTSWVFKAGEEGRGAGSGSSLLISGHIEWPNDGPTRMFSVGPRHPASHLILAPFLVLIRLFQYAIGDRTEQ